MRARFLTLAFASLALAACTSGSSKPVNSATSETATPPPLVLTVNVTDVVPLQIATNKDDKECYPSAVTVGASEKGAQHPKITVRDADGTIVGTADVSVSGSWTEDGCTMPTLVGEVPASDFYTLALKGDGGIFKIESHEFEKTVEAEPVDGELVVEWEL
ncbi:hypothetical protein [Brachybacterium sp. GCM10030252]|uniref:hypothetical protein n=1 Tax=Brachybacterium sp. GCM10030252 TaxID=3273380 RepID=UPI00361E2D52